MKLLSLMLSAGLAFCPVSNNVRIETGVYHDYLVISTTDSEWLLDDSSSSKYLDSSNNAIFEDGDLVIVFFDTMGTETKTDDIIINVKEVE